MSQYNHTAIEKKWRENWEKHPINVNDGKKEKILLPGYVPISVRKWSARWSLERLRYFRCMEPLSAAARQIRDPSDGLGRIGLPAENYAIKMGVHPAISTESNIKNIKRQINEIAAIYDWDMEVNTTDPAFYKWTQWIFVQMFKKVWHTRKNSRSTGARPVRQVWQTRKLSTAAVSAAVPGYQEKTCVSGCSRLPRTQTAS